MIYTLKRNIYDDEITSDNAFFYEYNDIVLNTDNIFSIEEYQDANDTKIYGIRINGVKYPMFTRDYIEWLVGFEEKDKEKSRFFEELRESQYSGLSYPSLSEQKQEWWDEFNQAVCDKCEKEYKYIEKQVEKIIKIMKRENNGRNKQEEN